jgi:hypothetical protein
MLSNPYFSYKPDSLLFFRNKTRLKILSCTSV